MSRQIFGHNAVFNTIKHRKIKGTTQSLHQYFAHRDHIHVSGTLTKEGMKELEKMIGNTYKPKVDEALPEPTHTYQSLEEELYHKGHGAEMDKRKVGNNTWLIRGDERVHVKLHQTHILTFTPDNRVILNSGGWETATTKDRMNAFLGWNTVFSNRGDWQVSVRFWLPAKGEYNRGGYVEATVPFYSGMALDVRTHELVEHPDTKFIDIDDSLVMREASDLSRLLSVHSRRLEQIAKEGTLTKDDLKSAMRILDRYREEQAQIQRRVKSLESSMSWASSRLEDVIEQAMKQHAEENLEHKERHQQLPGQERMKDLL